MTDLVKNQPRNLVERARDFVEISEDDLKRFAAEACCDREVEALWLLTEAHLTFHGSSGAWVSSHTLAKYGYGVLDPLLHPHVRNELVGHISKALYMRTVTLEAERLSSTYAQLS